MGQVDVLGGLACCEACGVLRGGGGEWSACGAVLLPYLSAWPGGARRSLLLLLLLRKGQREEMPTWSK